MWRAKNTNGQFAALKILKTKRSSSSQVKRFKTEIEFLQNIGDKPGLLPILDASLPDVLTDEDPAWFAMPEATLIKNALGDNPALETVVEAIRDIARTLAGLAKEGISHRDIKPDNLYRHEQAWAVGDFGLVSFPSKEAITQEGNKLGPLYFIAPEMLSNPTTAAGAPADVYSLMKTFWVLATGQKFPPPGQQRIEIPAHTLSTYVNHARVKLLDRLLERATADDPNSRPSMTEVEIELTSWLSPKVVPHTSPDLTDLSNRISASAVPRRRLAAQQQGLQEEHTRFVDSLRDKMQPTAERIAQAIGIGAVGFDLPMTISTALGMFKEKKDGRLDLGRGVPSVIKGGIETRAVIPGNGHVSLLSGIITTLYEDRIVGLEAAHFVRLMTSEALCPATMIWSVNCGLELVWYTHEEAPLGSAHIENVAVTIASGLDQNLRRAFERFTELLESG